MITIIKNAVIYSPRYLGKKDIVIASNKIEGIYDNVIIPKDFCNINIIDADNNIVVPGFIDPHVHITGGGGEGGFSTRTPEITLSKIVSSGITTVVGCLGTDSVCRSMGNLLAKANGLEEEGITSYIYTGSYSIPVVNSITENAKSDIILIDKIIGIGEVAISDHRSSQPSFHDFIKICAQGRVGGLISGKAGIINVHVGAGRAGIEYLFETINNTEIPMSQIIPTHMGRNKELFEQGVKYAKQGGFIDFTTSSDIKSLEAGEIKASTALKMALEQGVDIKQLQFSSDGQGSLPIFNERRQFVGLGIGSVKSLYEEFKDCVTKENIKFEQALQVVTSNVADHLKLKNKGYIEKNKDADIVILNKNNLDIDMVMCKGKVFVKEGNVIQKGVFEK
ncbi:beta-aspartyl-peptidase [Clostridium niameyense]|uniref:Isoaspartyl dipeptidase n=1 Tax=Clostridium niameyense TaxID=1622073 RepID=A0A6M0R8T8_9CLOT|nr:beta-aspartyl-peptidase [Clostridium niameyense]NEZ46662.1 beta-aspartyl-peptidase [Clostridium niameyense]